MSYTGLLGRLSLPQPAPRQPSTMNATHFDQLFVLTTAGLGLFLAGGLNFARWVERAPHLASRARYGCYLRRLRWQCWHIDTNGIGPLCRGGSGSNPARRFPGRFRLVHASTGFSRHASPPTAGSRWLQVCFVGLVILMAGGVLFDLNDQAEIDGAMRDFGNSQPDGRPSPGGERPRDDRLWKLDRPERTDLAADAERTDARGRGKR